MKQVNIFKCVPVQMTNSKFQQDIKFLAISSYHLKTLKWRGYFYTFLTSLQLLQCIVTSNSKIKITYNSVSNTIVGYLAFLILSACGCYLHLIRDRGNELQVYTNDLLAFKTKYSSNNDKMQISVNAIDFLSLQYILFGLIAGVIFSPCFVMGIHWGNPCKTSLLGYYILDECWRIETTDIQLVQFLRRAITKIMVFVLNIWMWYFGSNGMVFVGLAINVICTMMFRKSINLVKSRLKSTTNYLQDAQLYRQFQIFNTFGNIIQQYIVLVLLIAATSCMSISLMSLVRLSSNLNDRNNIFVLLVYGISASNGTFAMLVLLGGMVSVYTESNNLFKIVKKLDLSCGNRVDRMWRRRYWKSCTLIKFKFGDSNFIETLTPLRCLDFSLNFTLQLLLLFTMK